MLKARAVLVETVPTRIVEVPHGGSSVFIGLGAGETVYFGDETVNSTHGFVLAGAATITFDNLEPSDVIYGIAAAATTINVLVRTPGETEPEFGAAP